MSKTAQKITYRFCIRCGKPLKLNLHKRPEAWQTVYCSDECHVKFESRPKNCATCASHTDHFTDDDRFDGCTCNDSRANSLRNETNYHKYCDNTSVDFDIEKDTGNCPFYKLGAQEIA